MKERRKHEAATGSAGDDDENPLKSFLRQHKFIIDSILLH